MNVTRRGIRDHRGARIGLVLGAGGVVGQAYQAGVLDALEREAGWDPRQATIIVGTSAGSVTGAALRVGIPASDLAASAHGAPLSPRGAALLQRILPADAGPLPVPSLRSLFRPWSPPSPALLTRAAQRPWAFRPEVAAMTMVPRGRIDITSRARGLDEMMGDTWPQGLRICAVRRTDGARVVFGRMGSPKARLAEAVLASCAIPGYFSPIAIGGMEYVDGGVHSITNADVVKAEQLDVVIVVSSMSASHGNAYGADGFIRRSVHRRMEHEVTRLEQHGVAVIRLEPGGESRQVMGLRAMAEDRGPRVVEAAYEETRRRVRSNPFLAGLGQPVRSSAAV